MSLASADRHGAEGRRPAVTRWRFADRAVARQHAAPMADIHLSGTPSSASVASPRSPSSHVTHARHNSRLVGIVGGDRARRREIKNGPRWITPGRTRNTTVCGRVRRGVHRAAELAARRVHGSSARAVVHVLCRSRWGWTVAECERMMEACRANLVKLMIAYRLHFEEIDPHAIDLVRAAGLASPKYLRLVFLDDGAARRYPDEEGNGRRNTLRHRRLLHRTRRATCSVPSRPRSWRCRSTAA